MVVNFLWFSQKFTNTKFDWKLTVSVAATLITYLKTIRKSRSVP